ncbi:MAG: hypothetical protein Ct9H300mP4_10430 [Gammaproteobacteria bacterium]|nr:MAG: hypothetical protein Ct9H300mP4_10430 [Gammaproteobacteria bacterium]
MLEPRYGGMPTFMRTPLAETLENLDIALAGVPYDGGETQSSRCPSWASRDEKSIQLGSQIFTCYSD